MAACTHANMEISDLISEIFCSGVNLPAHTVIIKGTQAELLEGLNWLTMKGRLQGSPRHSATLSNWMQVYNPQKGAWDELSSMDMPPVCN